MNPAAPSPAARRRRWPFVAAAVTAVLVASCALAAAPKAPVAPSAPAPAPAVSVAVEAPLPQEPAPTAAPAPAPGIAPTTAPPARPTVAAPTPRPPQAPAPAANRTCGDFTTWREAAAYYQGLSPAARDKSRLDQDHDGVACESLPGAPAARK